MKILKALLPQSKVDFIWVAKHYDYHINGICKYDNEICEFKGIEPNWNPKKDDWDETWYEIYKLSTKEKIKWKIRQKKFELMVGYHWSYPQRKEGTDFYIRKPKWFFNMLFRIYYKLKK